MDAAGVSLVLIGPGNVDQAFGFSLNLPPYLIDNSCDCSEHEICSFLAG